MLGVGGAIRLFAWSVAHTGATLRIGRKHIRLPLEGRRLPVAIVLRFDRVGRREPSPTSSTLALLVRIDIVAFVGMFGTSGSQIAGGNRFAI